MIQVNQWVDWKIISSSRNQRKGSVILTISDMLMCLKVIDNIDFKNNFVYVYFIIKKYIKGIDINST